MNGGQVMVILIVLIAVVGSIVKGRRRDERRRDRSLAADAADADPDAIRLREEVRALRERVQVLERVITDTHARNDLDHQIEQLRDRR